MLQRVEREKEGGRDCSSSKAKGQESMLLPREALYCPYVLEEAKGIFAKTD